MEERDVKARRFPMIYMNTYSWFRSFTKNMLINSAALEFFFAMHG